jgi:hypothetical protein
VNDIAAKAATLPGDIQGMIQDTVSGLFSKIKNGITFDKKRCGSASVISPTDLVDIGTLSTHIADIFPLVRKFITDVFAIVRTSLQGALNR